MKRRSFLSGILAAGTGPAIITSPGILMPIKKLILPTGDPNRMLIVPRYSESIIDCEKVIISMPEDRLKHLTDFFTAYYEKQSGVKLT